VRTKTLDFSFNELLDMAKEDELIIRPEYQRLFKWSEDARSRFIESLILEMPIPPIFLVENDDGTYELIDGLQRLSSYMHFRGELKSEDEPLRLIGCDIVPELDGLTYGELEAALQIRLKRHFVRAQIIKRGSDPHLRYHMFKRLNRGGETLEAQEVRNCTIRLLGAKFIDFLNELAQGSSFQECMDLLSERQKDSMVREEYVLRFFAFKNYRGAYVKDITPFLDEYLERVTEGNEPFDYQNERRIFRAVFDALQRSLGEQTEQAFSAANQKGTMTNQFRSLLFEPICLGLIGAMKVKGTIASDALKKALNELKQDKTFRNLTTGGGKNYAKAMTDRLEYAESFLLEKL
jgi:hypothetical protein